MHLRYSISLVFFLIILFANTQPTNPSLKDYQRANQLYNLDNPTEETDRQALHLYQQVAKKLSSNAEYAPVVFQCHLKSGILKQSSNEQQSSIAFFNNAIAAKERSLLPDSLLFQPFLYIGSAHYSLNDFDSAGYYFKKAETLLERNPTLSERERLFNKIGSMFFETGDYLQSKIYFEKALTLLDTTVAGSEYLYVNYKNNIASALRKLRQYPEALAIYKSLLAYKIELNGLLHNIGDTYLGMESYEEALHFLNATSYSTQVKFNDLGFAHYQLKHYDSAEYYLNAALALSASIGKSTSTGVTLSHLAELKLAQGKIDEALAYYQRSIIQLDPDFNDSAIHNNPIDFQGIHSMFNLFDALVGKARALRMAVDVNKDQHLLILSTNTLKSAFTLADRAFENFASDDARFFLNEKVQPAYQAFVDRSLQLYDLSKDARWLKEALSMAEKSKGLVLRSSLQQLPLYNIRGIPGDLIRKEKNLKSKITRFTLALNNVSDSSQAFAIRQLIIDAQIALSKVHEQLSKEASYSAIMNTSPLDLGDVQKNLSNDQAILSFYFADDLVIFSVTNQDFGFKRSPKSGDVSNEVRRLIEMIRIEAADRQAVGVLQQRLFESLIEPVLPLLNGKTRLIIIPHKELAYLPLELLVSKNGAYLCEDFSTSYNYSMTFLNQNSPGTSTNELLAFAPFASSSTDKLFEAIPASKDEVSSLRGEVYIDSRATKQRFIEHAPAKQVVHLATHASANDSLPMQSFIAFYPQQQTDTAYKLYEPEIFNLDLRASRLLILSACETGKGKLVHGEGLLSLSRAFSYAGCPSIITSLWKADDQSTAYLSKRVHHYLNNGLPKDVSLQKARLDYLHDNDIATQFKQPHYWSHLLLVGDVSPLRPPKSYVWLVIGALLLVTISVVLLLRNSKAPQTLRGL